MYRNPHHAVDDTGVVRQIIQDQPFCTLVATVDGRPVASHCPVVLDERTDDLAVLTHLVRADPIVPGLGDGEVLLIVSGDRHGYVSPSWYPPGSTRAPTWNFSVAHCYGVPELLDEEQNLDALTLLVEHFERSVEAPMFLDRAWARPVARATLGLRLPVARFEAKVKMSGDKDVQTQRQVVAHLRASGPYRNPELADRMVEVLGIKPTATPGSAGGPDDVRAAGRGGASAAGCA